MLGVFKIGIVQRGTVQPVSDQDLFLLFFRCKRGLVETIVFSHPIRGFSIPFSVSWCECVPTTAAKQLIFLLMTSKKEREKVKSGWETAQKRMVENHLPQCLVQFTPSHARQKAGSLLVTDSSPTSLGPQTAKVTVESLHLPLFSP